MKVMNFLNIWAALLIAAGSYVGLAQELLTNGDFECDLSVGWFIDSLEGMTPYYDTVDRDTSFHPNPGYEARVKKYDSAFAKLFQTIDVATTNLRFGINAKLYAVELNQASAWAAAAIVLSYMNRSGAVLGETRICYPTPHCPWTNSPTLHLIVAPDSTWRAYSFKISDELANLPGVPPAEIAKVRVALFDTTDGC